MAMAGSPVVGTDGKKENTGKEERGTRLERTVLPWQLSLRSNLKSVTKLFNESFILLILLNEGQEIPGEVAKVT